MAELARTMPIPIPQDSVQDAYVDPLTTISENPAVQTKFELLLTQAYLADPNRVPTPTPENAPYADLIVDWDALVAYYRGGDPLTASRSQGGEVDAKLLLRAFGLPEQRFAVTSANAEYKEAVGYYAISTSGNLGKFIDTTVEVGPYVAGAVIVGGSIYGISAGGGLFPTAGTGAEIATGTEVVAASEAVAPVTAAEEIGAGVSLSGDYLLQGPTVFAPAVLEGGAAAGAGAGAGSLTLAGTLTTIGSSLYTVGKNIFGGTVQASTEKFTEFIDKEVSELFGGGGAVGGGTTEQGVTKAGLLDSLKSRGAFLPILGIILTLIFYLAYYKGRKRS